jgi:hypothetical protein
MGKAIKREVLGVPKTPNKNLLQYDDLDMRKYLYRGLARLTVRERLQFVNWCCRRQSSLPGCRAVPTAATRDATYYTVDHAVTDLSMLTVLGGGGGTDADVILQELERRLRKT